MIKQSTGIATLLLSLTLIACSQPAENPQDVADKYWQNLQQGNIAEAEKLVSANSRQAFNKHSDYIDSNTTVTNDNVTAIVNTTITRVNPQNNKTVNENIKTILVLEQGKWKIDTEQSALPEPASNTQQELQKFSNKLSESVQENIDSIDEAMNKGMQMLDETFQQGSEEMGQSLLKLMNELNTTMQESIEKMKKRRQQQLDEQKKTPSPPPDSSQGEGLI